MLDNVYTPYALDEFLRDSFHEMLDDLYPFDQYEENEEQFNSQFDGVEVLPLTLEDTFNSFIANQQFLEAEKLLVPISRARYYYYFNNGFISKLKKYKSIPTVDLDYDEKRGLLENDLGFD